MAASILDLAEFRIKRPEFSTAEDAMVQAFLDDAANQLDARIWASYLSQGHEYLTCHLLASAPNGQFARLESDKTETIYGKQFLRLEASVACCIRVF